MKKWRNKILSAVLVLSLLLTSSSFAFAEGDDTDYGTRIEPTAISLEGSSRKGDGDANNAFDGNTSTYWESAWDPVVDDSRFITLDLGSWTYLSHLTFIPRQKDTQFNGIPKYLYIYVSDVTTDFSGTSYSDENYEWKLAKIVDWTDLKSLIDNWGSLGQEDKNKVQSAKEIEFNNDISTRYVKLYAPETYHHGGETLFITDLTFYKNTDIANSNVPTITTQPQSNAYLNKNAIASLNVAVTESNITYQWYKTEDGTLDSGVVIPNAIASTYQPTDFGNYFVKVTSADGSYVFSNIAEIKSFEAKVNNNYYVSFKDAVSRALNGSTIEVLKDIELSSPITIDKEITIKSVDNLIRTTQLFTIKRTAGINNEMFTVATTGNLTLDNIIIDGGAVWGEDNTAATATSNSGIKGGALVKVVNNGTLTVKAGATLQNNENISSAGGAISADADGSNYSNIHVYGKILNNKVIESRWNNGGGIASDGDLYIYEGAVISGNFAPQSNEGGEGGGIQIFQAGSLYLYGGTIKDNRAGQCNNISFGNSDSARKRPVQLMGNVEIESINLKNKNDADTNKTIEVVGELNGSINVILGNGVDGDTIATINENVSKENILNVFKVNDKITYLSGNEVKFGTEANYSTNLASEKSVVANPDGTASTTLTVEATGTDVTYKWYKCITKDGEYEEIQNANEKTLTLNSLEKGSTYYYCVIDNGDKSTAGHKTSKTCEVKVSDFYPCSKAIDKFKNI